VFVVSGQTPASANCIANPLKPALGIGGDCLHICPRSLNCTE
jgi:hypothetical protein